MVRVSLFIFCAMIAGANRALAQTVGPAPESAQPASSDVGAAGGGATNSNLLGDLGGLRPFLSKYGVTLSVQEQSEILGNVTGGRQQGFEYDGLTTGTVRSIRKPHLAGMAACSTSVACKFMGAT